MDKASVESHREYPDESSSGPSVEATNRSVSSNENEDNAESSSGNGEALAGGLSAMIAAVIRDFDSKAEDALRSQNGLNESLDRLIQELDQLLENAPLPFIVQHAARISSVRKRVSSMNLLLKSIQRRIDNIDHTLTACAAHDKRPSESS